MQHSVEKARYMKIMLVFLALFFSDWIKWCDGWNCPVKLTRLLDDNNATLF